jgi:hypothetical protein
VEHRTRGAYCHTKKTLDSAETSRRFISVEKKKFFNYLPLQDLENSGKNWESFKNSFLVFFKFACFQTKAEA